MMRDCPHQGDVIKIDRIKIPVLVVSKDFFNETGEVIGCPVYLNGETGALHIAVNKDDFRGIVHCEKLSLLDLNERGYVKIDNLDMSDVINITDAIQGIFDYI